jgi:hypothetical protein
MDKQMKTPVIKLVGLDNLFFCIFIIKNPLLLLQPLVQFQSENHPALVDYKGLDLSGAVFVEV